MSALALLIPLSLLIVTAAAIVLLWAIKHGQYDSLENRMPDTSTETPSTHDSAQRSSTDRAEHNHTTVL